MEIQLDTQWSHPIVLRLKDQATFDYLAKQNSAHIDEFVCRIDISINLRPPSTMSTVKWLAPFVDLLTNGEFQAEADVNQDGEVELLDVAPFLDLMAGG